MKGKIRRSYIDGRWGQVHLRTAGNGKPLMLIHMSPTSSDMFTELIPHLAGARRVVAPDLPGYGASDPPPKPPAPLGYAGALHDIIEGARLEKTPVFAHHSGATLALQLAAAHPDTVSALILSCLPFYKPDIVEKERVLRVARTVPADGSFLQGLWASTSLEGPPEGDKEIDFSRRLMIAQLQTTPNWHYVPRAVLDVYPPALLQNLTIPVLFLYPEIDRFSAEQKELAAFTPNAEVKMLEGKKPRVIWKEPQLYANEILSFLDRHEV